MRRLIPSVFVAAALLVALPALAGDGSNLLQYVPSSASVVAGVDVEKLRGTALWDRLLSIASSDADTQRSLTTIQNDAGFDPRATTRSLVFASRDASGDMGEHAILLLELDYPAEGLASVLTADGYEAATSGSVTYYRKSESTVAFLTPNVVAVGEFALVEPAINVAAGTGTAGAGSTVSRQISAVDKSGGIWVAARLPSGSQGAQAARLSVNASSGLAARLDLVMESEETATNAVNQFNTQIAAVAGSPEVAALGLAAIVGGLQASASGSDVSLQVTLDAATWSSTLSTLAELAQEELR